MNTYRITFDNGKQAQIILLQAKTIFNAMRNVKTDLLDATIVKVEAINYRK
jgi:hypothetical protein